MEQFDQIPIEFVICNSSPKQKQSFEIMWCIYRFVSDYKGTFEQAYFHLQNKGIATTKGIVYLNWGTIKNIHIRVRRNMEII